MEFEPIIGLEIHAQLLTKSKIFCLCSTSFGSRENTQVCPVCLGLPGALPVLNRKVVEFAIRMGLATNCRIAEHTIFARKNYFYPDLPKGYQISQYEEPLCHDGCVEIESKDGLRRIGITRIHPEEDAGKSVHAEQWVSENETLVDINRCGVPLIEIVSRPDLRSPGEAFRYLTGIRQILLYLGICDGNMEEGSLRCDANISVRPIGQHRLGVKTELKNMNSFHGVERALAYEVKRQIDLISRGGQVRQETLLWDDRKNIAVLMRSKEMEHDYRYFPDPDLVPLKIDRRWIEEIQHSLPELPDARRKRLMSQYGLPPYEADVLTQDRGIADYFEAVAAVTRDVKLVSGWIMGEVLRILNDRKIEISSFGIQPPALSELLDLVSGNSINRTVARAVFEEMLSTGESAAAIVERKGLAQVSDSGELLRIVDAVIAEHPEEVDKFRSGRTQVFGFLVGQVMRATNGRANPEFVNRLLREKL